MSKELLEAIDKLDIRIFATTSGRQFIGKVSFDEDMKITLTSPLEFVEKLEASSKSNKTYLVTPVINNTAPIKLNPANIEYESIADISLKKIYCDQLIHNSLSILADEFIEANENIKSAQVPNYFNSVIESWNKNKL